MNLEKKYFLIANFKANFDYLETTSFLDILHSNYSNFFENKVMYLGFALSPESLSLTKKCSDWNINIGSQNVSKYSSGSFTGETTARSLKSLNVKFSLIGHNERRLHFKETNDDVNNKIKLALKNNILPIICVGETLEEFKKAETLEVIERQLNFALEDIETTKDFIISYEPIFSVGTGIVTQNSHIENVAKIIKRIVNKPILYGGSVNNENIEELMKIDFLSGFLVGKESLNYSKFGRLIEKVMNKKCI